jgi:hypothetical protein
MCNTKIKKYTCKLAKSIKKYIDLLSYGVSKKCDYKDIKLKKALINILKRNQECCTDCTLEGKYEFVLPGNQTGYIEFLCDNLGYLHIPGQLPKKITYDYYNEELHYNLGETEIEIILETHISTSLWDNNTSIVFYNDVTSIFEEPLGFDSIEEFIISFNENNTGGFILELKDGYILVLNSEGQNIQLNNLHLLISDTDIVSTIEEVEIEVPITYTTDITFDDDCNIIGEFDFNLYCIAEVEVDFEGVTSQSEFFGSIYINEEYQMPITYEQTQNPELIQEAWNNLFQPNISLVIENDVFTFYSLTSLEFCEEETEVVISLLKGEFASAIAQFTIPVEVIEQGNPACTILDIDYDIFFSGDYESFGIYWDNNLILNYDQVFTNINDFIDYFNLTNSYNFVAEIFSQTELPNTTYNGETLDIFINSLVTPVFQSDPFNPDTATLIGDIDDVFSAGQIIYFRIDGLSIYTVALTENLDWLGLINLFNTNFSFGLSIELISTDPIGNTYTFQVNTPATGNFDYQIRICSNEYPQEDLNGTDIDIYTYINSNLKLEVNFTVNTDFLTGPGTFAVLVNNVNIFDSPTDYPIIEDLVNNFNLNNTLNYTIEIVSLIPGTYNIKILSDVNNIININDEVVIVSNKDGGDQFMQVFNSVNINGTLSGGVNSLISVIVSNFNGEFYNNSYTNLNDFIADFNLNEEGAILEIIEITEGNYIIQITSPPGSGFNGTLWFITFNEDEELEFISTEAEGGSNPITEIFEGVFNDENPYLIDTLTKISTPCKINCLTEDEIKTITDYLDK